MGRKPKTEVNSVGSKCKNIVNHDADSVARRNLAARCGRYGCTPIETEAKLETTLSTADLIKAYEGGKAEHAFTIMQAIYDRAMDGSEKLLIWLAENSLKRNLEAQTGNAIIDAMTPEQRREKIRELTKKLGMQA